MIHLNTCLKIKRIISYQVKVSIVSETQANQIIGRNKPDGESCGEILNCTGKMEYQPVQRHLSTNFR